MNINMQKLEIAMATNCLNPSDLCQKAKISYQTFVRIRSGAKVKYATVGKIARALNIKVEDIIRCEQ